MDITGSDNASLVVKSFVSDPSLLVSWPEELVGMVPGGSVPESSNCGRIENVPVVGVRVDVDAVEDEQSSAVVEEGKEVQIILAGRMSELGAALSRRVATDGMAT